MHGGNLATATPSVATTIPESGMSNARQSILAAAPDTSSVLTVRASPVVGSPPLPGRAPPAIPSGLAMPIDKAGLTDEGLQARSTDEALKAGSRMSIDTYHTATSRIGAVPITDSVAMGSIAGATEGSTMTTDGLGDTHSLIHRFTLIKPGSARKGSISGPPGSPLVSPGGRAAPSNGRVVSPNGRAASPPPDQAPAWSPFEFFFSSGMGAKCDLCAKRLGWGWKPVLECDDCGMR
jgi:LIM domain kinase 1